MFVSKLTRGHSDNGSKGLIEGDLVRKPCLICDGIHGVLVQFSGLYQSFGMSYAELVDERIKITLGIQVNGS